jgi:DNA invertase Pin-like site-specific DNA recombinase
MRKFAWYGRLSTKDKQDPTISFPSQRNECAEKAEEPGGRIVCDFTDQEAGRRDDRVGWSELIREAKEPDARRFDAVIVYSTSRLSRELFHALAYERELARAGVEVFYARSAGDQTSPEGRLIRHMLQALDQFGVEKLGREVRRGQTENTRQGYRNGGRAPDGHNPLRMQGKHRKSSTYYTCGYRLSYGDTAAEATGHGKWQCVREDSLLTLIDAFFATRVFGADRLAPFRKQSSTLGGRIGEQERLRAGTRRSPARRGRAANRAPARRDQGRRRSGPRRRANPCPEVRARGSRGCRRAARPNSAGGAGRHRGSLRSSTLCPTSPSHWPKPIRSCATPSTRPSACGSRSTEMPSKYG